LVLQNILFGTARKQAVNKRPFWVYKQRRPATLLKKIYRYLSWLNNDMKKSIDAKRLRFYGWVGLAFLLLGLLHDGAQHPERWTTTVLNNTWAAMYVTILNVVFFEYTWPRLRWKNAGSSVLRILGHIILYSWGLYVWRGIGIGLHIYTPLETYNSVSKNVSARMSYSIESLFFFGIIRHIYNYTRLKQATQQLRIEKQAAELSYLRAQTNPHFLFNTLNNIYSLSRDKSDLAPESILRLSKILRYMLYETSGDWIAIEQEIKITGDYIALEKLRYDDSLRVNFNHDIEDRQQALPPLLLVPLVENAFKHGVSETRNQPFIDIHLSVSKRRLVFIVKNSTGDLAADGRIKENIGLSNLRRQLELLYTDYDLSVVWNQAVFTATLHINLASHV
jgi:two-component system LytT family sensor kinase